MNIRCAFGWHRWEELWSVWHLHEDGPIPAYTVIVNTGRICADCRKRVGL